MGYCDLVYAKNEDIFIIHMLIFYYTINIIISKTMLILT